MDVLKAIVAGNKTRSGKSVTIKTALEVATVFACIRAISEGVAQVPLKVFKDEGENKNPATKHPLYDLLHRKPNENDTSFKWRETLTMNAALAGDGFSFINRGRGKVLELLNIDPSLVEVEEPERLGDRPKYFITGKSGARQEFPAESILHIPGPVWSGASGMEAYKTAREALGLSMAIEESSARFHANGARPGGMYSVDGTLSPEQYKALKSWLDEEVEGASNTGRTVLLDRGAKFVSMAMTGVDAQQLETRRFQIEEICRFFRVLPIMVMSSDKATTYASAEQMFLAHVVHTLSPWFERIEQAIDCQLLTDAERAQGYYVKFITQGLLRGALKDTAEYLYRLVNIGIMTRNEARGLLEMNPIEGLDSPLTPVNMDGGNDEGIS
jgi:HK97 family phage portal protein